jgi:hypothetical protein
MKRRKILSDEEVSEIIDDNLDAEIEVVLKDESILNDDTFRRIIDYGDILDVAERILFTLASPRQITIDPLDIVEFRKEIRKSPALIQEAKERIAAKIKEYEN